MVSSASNRLADVIQPTERLLISLDDVQDAASRSASDGRARPSWIRSRTGRRGISVVIREGKESSSEIASVLVWQDVTGPVVVGVVPILADFDISISQTDKLSTNGSSTPKTKFLVTLNAPSSPTSPPSRAPFMTSFAFIRETLDSTTTEFVSQLKRLHQIASTNNYTESSKSHDWAKAYLPPTGVDSVSRSTTPEPVSALQTLAGKYARPDFDRVSSAYSSRASLKPDAAAHSSTLSPPLSRSTSSSPKSTRSHRLLDSPDDRADSEYSKQAHEAIETWVVERMRKRESDFLVQEQIRIWQGTFNVNDKLPRPDGSDLTSWCQAGIGAELLVFSFQELDLSTEAMLRYTTYREEAWREAIDSALGEKRSEYEWLHSKQLVGVLTIAYARKDVRKHISTVSSASLATGFLGLMANKGVVGIRLKYKDTPITLLNSHLAAFSSQVQQRNAQYRDIASQLLFPYVEGEARDPWTPNLKFSETTERPQGEGWSVNETAVLIWAGDLNYRLELPRAEVEQLIANQDWERLRQFDQLELQKQHHLAFSDFEEATIDFPPTYKFDKGTSDYDTSEKQRVPSWTDRILWLSLNRGEVSAASYSSYDDCLMSDHKPVSAVLTVPVSTVDEKQRNEVQQQVIAELAKFGNDSLPDVKILPGPSVEFDEVRFDEPVSKTIQIANIGQSLAPWSFVLKPGTNSLLPPWLSIVPTSGLVIPGERTTITLTIHVTPSCSPALNFPLPSADEALSDLFVLSIEKRDLFLAVSARSYQPSVFGSSLEHLARLRKPIRSTTFEERQQIASAVETIMKPPSERNEDERKNVQRVGTAGVPRAIHQLVNFLAEYGLETEDVFSEEGDGELVKLVKESLDNGNELPLDRLGFARPNSQASSDDEGDKQHLREAVSALERLESDIGSLSMEGTATPPVQPRKPSKEESALRRVGVHSVAACLLALLESLAEPVIPFEMYGRALRCEKREEALGLVQDLPEVHANVLLYLLAFLRVLLNQTRDVRARANRMNQFAIVFSLVLLREPPTFSHAGLDVSTLPKKRKNFVYWVLEEK
ncbi:uncharacterized protein JCM6883_004396 [Sporobolomyces salmoneus]|uniref:uncharacterized protein n=1 Tax=Sporobolomyces salmoneus TaxID=183962 RepID=UPI00316E9812